MEDDDIDLPTPGPDLGLIRAVLSGDAAPFNLSAAMNFADTQDGYEYWDLRMREGLDEEARGKLQAMIVGG